MADTRADFFCVRDVANRQALWAEDLGEHRGQAWKAPAILYSSQKKASQGLMVKQSRVRFISI